MYSLKKGFSKGLVTALVTGGAMVAFAGFSDMTIWSLIETHVKPLVGSMTVGGALAMLLNYVKVQAKYA